MTNLEGKSLALFLDLDGTLAELQPRPDLAFIPTETLSLLIRLQQSDVQLVAITGRDVDAAKALLAPVKCPIAGVHGAVCRDALGKPLHIFPPLRRPEALRRRLARLSQEFPGTILEDKLYALALHYRLVPQYEAQLEKKILKIVSNYPDWTVGTGKCVFEIRSDTIDKGSTIRHIMQLPRFAGRFPVFIGDDVCDEPGFAAVNALGGLSIKVGLEPSCARHRLRDAPHVHQWLGNLLPRVPRIMFPEHTPLVSETRSPGTARLSSSGRELLF